MSTYYLDDVGAKPAFFSLADLTSLHYSGHQKELPPPRYMAHLHISLNSFKLKKVVLYGVRLLLLPLRPENFEGSFGLIKNSIYFKERTKGRRKEVKREGDGGTERHGRFSFLP